MLLKQSQKNSRRNGKFLHTPFRYKIGRQISSVSVCRTEDQEGKICNGFDLRLEYSRQRLSSRICGLQRSWNGTCSLRRKEGYEEVITEIGCGVISGWRGNGRTANCAARREAEYICSSRNAGRSSGRRGECDGYCF